jgi:signal transduction histidine kinase
MVVDTAGDFWAGTSGGVLLHLVGDELVNETPEAMVPPRAIQSLCATDDGSVWVGYAGAGLGRLHQGRFTLFGVEQGLRDNYVAQVISDGGGELWWAGNRGVFHGAIDEFDAVSSGHLPRVQSVVYGYEDGFAAVQASHGFWPGSFRDLEGRLWFPLLTGLLSVDVDSAGGNPIEPPVVIARVIVDDAVVASRGFDQLRSRSLDDSIVEMHKGELRLRLTPAQRRVRLEFSALSFVSPQNVSFKYVLEGLDEDWVDLGNQRAVDLVRLPPGDHRFHVISSNNEGIWNERGASLAITVIPPFWQTTWFIVVVSLAALGGATGTIRYVAVRRVRRRIEQLKREHAVELERTRIAKDIHDDLGANLTEITLLSELSMDDEVPREEVQSDLRRIASKARQLTSSIADIVWAVNPQHDALDSFISYACTYAEDYLRSAQLRCRLDVPQDPPSIAVPAAVRHDLFLMLKEALNNIVKHASASEVTLRMILDQAGFRLTVSDDGCGFDPETVLAVDEVDRRGYGLYNMRKRVEHAGGVFELHSQPGRGTRIEVILNLGGRG